MKTLFLVISETYSLIIQQRVGNSIFINAFDIIGHCTEFNEVGRVIQIHNTAPCEEVFPNCDDAYRSVDAYKCMYTHTKDTLINIYIFILNIFIKYDIYGMHFTVHMGN